MYRHGRRGSRLRFMIIIIVVVLFFYTRVLHYMQYSTILCTSVRRKFNSMTKGKPWSRGTLSVFMKRNNKKNATTVCCTAGSRDSPFYGTRRKRSSSATFAYDSIKTTVVKRTSGTFISPRFGWFFFFVLSFYGSPPANARAQNESIDGRVHRCVRLAPGRRYFAKSAVSYARACFRRASPYARPDGNVLFGAHRKTLMVTAGRRGRAFNESKPRRTYCRNVDIYQLPRNGWPKHARREYVARKRNAKRCFRR